MNPSIDHGCAFNPNEEGGGRVLDEEFIKVNGLVYSTVHRKWGTIADVRGEEWEMLGWFGFYRLVKSPHRLSK